MMNFSVLKIKIENADVNRKFSPSFLRILQSIYAKGSFGRSKGMVVQVQLRYSMNSFIKNAIKVGSHRG